MVASSANTAGKDGRNATIKGYRGDWQQIRPPMVARSANTASKDGRDATTKGYGRDATIKGYQGN